MVLTPVRFPAADFGSQVRWFEGSVEALDPWLLLRLRLSHAAAAAAAVDVVAGLEYLGP